MVLQDYSKPTKYGSSVLLRIPAKVWKDKRYPFKMNEQVLVKIVGKTIVTEKAE